jgi:hypothetical protein
MACSPHARLVRCSTSRINSAASCWTYAAPGLPASRVSEPGPLNVAVIEDVHWADEATIDLLRFLGRRVRNAAMLLIVTYRDDGSVVSDPLRLALVLQP